MASRIAVVAAVLPMIIVFQRFFVQSIIVSGLKG